MSTFENYQSFFVGDREVNALSIGNNEAWTGTVPLPNIGDPFMGGFFAGIIDTTKGNIDPADYYQSGQRYALIVSPKSFEERILYSMSTHQEVSTPTTRTRWDGLSSTDSLDENIYKSAGYCRGLAYPSDGASHWYLPAMDEALTLYQNFKPVDEPNNTTRQQSGWAFPSNFARPNDNISSEPPFNYTRTSPGQTTVARFQTGGEEELPSSFWVSTEASENQGWAMMTSGYFTGVMYLGGRNGQRPVRPVRRLILPPVDNG